MVRILLTDEQKVIREGLRFLLESKPDIEIVAAVSNSYAAISKIESTNPDILFVGIKIAEIEGLDIIGIIRQKYPQLKIIIFSDRTNEQYLFQLLEMGIKGYLLKSTPVEEIVEAIYAVAKGYTHISNGAYDNVPPQISQTLSEQNFPEAKIVFDDISNDKELPELEKTEAYTDKEKSSTISSSDRLEIEPVSQQTKQQAAATSNRDEDTNYKNEYPINQKNPQSNPVNSSLIPLDKFSSAKTDSISNSQSPADKTAKVRGFNRYFPLVALASLGLLTVSIGIISLINRSSPQLVVENAVVNGKTVEIDSPIKGKVVAVNYPQGASITPESIIATVEPIGDRLSSEQLQDRIQLKQQQYTIAQESLAFLENSLNNIGKEALDSSPEKLDNLISSIYLNQIKQQEVSLETAQLRENIAKNSYENLQKLESERISQAQLNLAENSWKLAQITTEEIAVNLEIIRQEYQLVKQQISGNNSQFNDLGSQKLSRLQKQISNQKAISNILQKEIDDLETQLSLAPSKPDQAIAIKSPIAGSIYNQKYLEGEIVDVAETITTIIDCNNLWVEATVKPQVSDRVSPQDSVLVTITDSDLSLQGKISSIESVKSNQLNNVAATEAIKTQVPTRLTNADYYKIIVEVSSSSEQLNEQQFCSVGQTAKLSFGENKEPLASFWQPKIISNLITK